MVVAALILGALFEPGHEIDELIDRFLVAIFIEHAFGHLSSFQSGEACHSDAINHRIMQLGSEIELPLSNVCCQLSEPGSLPDLFELFSIPACRDQRQENEPETCRKEDELLHSSFFMDQFDSITRKTAIFHQQIRSRRRNRLDNMSQISGSFSS